MNWWNKKYLWLVFGVLLLLAGGIVVLMMLGPLVGGQMCTLVGCVGGLNVELAGLPAFTPYQIELAFPSGETQTVTCDPGAADESEPFVKSCSAGGAFFSLEQDVKPPQEITITVSINGDQITQVFQPKYEAFQPNGSNCPPVCYNATVELNVSR